MRKTVDYKNINIFHTCIKTSEEILMQVVSPVRCITSKVHAMHPGTTTGTTTDMGSQKYDKYSFQKDTRHLVEILSLKQRKIGHGSFLFSCSGLPMSPTRKKAGLRRGPRKPLPPSPITTQDPGLPLQRLAHTEAAHAKADGVPVH